MCSFQWGAVEQSDLADPFKKETKVDENEYNNYITCYLPTLT